jgi:glucosamine 6-phosphate synthetase-like amidotransferase/phosphosugar isomerase protein
MTFNKRLEGWYSVPWVDLNDPEVLHLARHNAPLALGMTKQGIYFSSDIEHLKAVNILLQSKMTVLMTSNNTVYTLRSSGEHRIEKLKIHPPIVKYTFSNHWYDYNYAMDKSQYNWLPKNKKNKKIKLDKRLKNLSYFANTLGYRHWNDDDEY